MMRLFYTFFFIKQTMSTRKNIKYKIIKETINFFSQKWLFRLKKVKKKLYET